MPQQVPHATSKKRKTGAKPTAVKPTRATAIPPMAPSPMESAPEPLVTAHEIEARLTLKRRALYIMAKKGLIVSYRTGAKGGGIRFRMSEVLSGLRRPMQSEPTTAEQQQAGAETKA